MTTKTEKNLIGAETLLRVIWPEQSDRPSMRWLIRQRKRGTIPYVKIGHRVWFYADDVRAAIAEKFTVNSAAAPNA